MPGLRSRSDSSGCGSLIILLMPPLRGNNLEGHLVSGKVRGNALAACFSLLLALTLLVGTARVQVPVVFKVSDDAERLHDEFRVAGATIGLPPTNYPWAYEFHVMDRDGHVLRFGSEQKTDQPFSAWVCWYRETREGVEKTGN